MVRTTVICAAILIAPRAGGQDVPADAHLDPLADAPTISLLLESDDPAIDASELRAALSEALDRPVEAIVEAPLLTIVGVVSASGASIQVIDREGTSTFVLPRGEPGWLLHWLSQEIAQRVPQPSASEPAFAGVESAAGLSPPAAPVVTRVSPTGTTGWLNLLSVPSARVTLGGDRIGTTPLVGHELPAGTHQLVLTTSQGTSLTIDVTIEAGVRSTRALSIR